MCEREGTCLYLPKLHTLQRACWPKGQFSAWAGKTGRRPLGKCRPALSRPCAWSRPEGSGAEWASGHPPTLWRGICGRCRGRCCAGGWRDSVACSLNAGLLQMGLCSSAHGEGVSAHTPSSLPGGVRWWHSSATLCSTGIQCFSLYYSWVNLTVLI